MIDEVLDIMAELDEAKAELEELEECGDLEERLEAAQKVEDIKNRLFKARMRDTGERC